jgi:Ran GTPase-activating protein (RanGAP) involved in mRNA processing and transport
MLPILGLELLYNVFALGYCNLNSYGNEEVLVAFIRRRSCEPLKWRQFDEISKGTISKIKYTALLQKWMKPSLKSYSAIYDYVKVQ